MNIHSSVSSVSDGIRTKGSYVIMVRVKTMMKAISSLVISIACCSVTFANCNPPFGTRAADAVRLVQCLDSQKISQLKSRISNADPAQFRLRADKKGIPLPGLKRMAPLFTTYLYYKKSKLYCWHVHTRQTTIEGYDCKNPKEKPAIDVMGTRAIKNASYSIEQLQDRALELVKKFHQDQLDTIKASYSGFLESGFQLKTELKPKEFKAGEGTLVRLQRKGKDMRCWFVILTKTPRPPKIIHCAP